MSKSFSLKDYDILDRRFDSNFSSDIQLLKNKQNEKDIKLMKEYYYIEMNSLETEIENLEKMIAINNKCPHLVRIFGFTHSKDGQLCGKIQKIYIISEYMEINLRELLEDRINRTIYTEKDYFKFIETITQALKYLKEFGIPYDSLKLSMIFRTKQGEFKILMPKLFNVLPNYMDFLRSFNKEDFFLAPEALQNIKEKSIFINFDQYKADAFVLGCLVLEMMEKITCSEFFNLQDFNLNRKLLVKALDSVKKEYSLGLFSILEEMLELNPLKRIGFNEILSKISNENAKNNNNNNMKQMVKFDVFGFNFIN